MWFKVEIIEAPQGLTVRQVQEDEGVLVGHPEAGERVYMDEATGHRLGVFMQGDSFLALRLIPLPPAENPIMERTEIIQGELVVVAVTEAQPWGQDKPTILVEPFIPTSI